MLLPVARCATKAWLADVGGLSNWRHSSRRALSYAVVLVPELVYTLLYARRASAAGPDAGLARVLTGFTFRGVFVAVKAKVTGFGASVAGQVREFS